MRSRHFFKGRNRYHRAAQRLGHLKIYIIFKQDSRSKGNPLFLQFPVHRDAKACPGNHKHPGSSLGTRHLHAAKQPVVAAGFHIVERLDGMALQHLLRCTICVNGLSFDAQQIIRDFRGEVDFVQRQDHGNSLFPGHFPQNVQKLNFIADIQISRGLVQHDDLRLLTQCPGQQNPLPLPIGQGREVPLGQVQPVDPLQRLLNCRLVFFCQAPKEVRIGIAAHGNDLRAGGQLRADTVGEHHGHLLCQLLWLPLLQGFFAHKHPAGDGLQMPGDGL